MEKVSFWGEHGTLEMPKRAGQLFGIEMIGSKDCSVQSIGNLGSEDFVLLKQLVKLLNEL